MKVTTFGPRVCQVISAIAQRWTQMNVDNQNRPNSTHNMSTVSSLHAQTRCDILRRLHDKIEMLIDRLDSFSEANQA